MASLRDLFITIGFDIDDKPLQQVEAGIRSLTVGITYLTAQAVASATSLFMLTKSTADEGAAALRSAQMLGINVETLQGLGHAAEKTGMTLEEVENGLQRMARSAYEASKSGSSLTNVYNKLRIHTRDSNGQVRSSEEILMDLSDRFQSMPDGLQKTALAMEIFGRSGARMIPILNKGRNGIHEITAEAKEMGEILSEQDVQAGKEFKLSLLEITEAIHGIKNQIGTALMPIMTALAKKIGIWIKQNREFIKTKISEYVQRMINYIKQFYGWTVRTITAVQHLVGGFENLENILLSVAKLFTMFAALAIINGIGKMAIGIVGLVMGLKELKMATIATQASALLMPILVGAAIVGLILILEDLYTYFSGSGKSITGLLVEWFSKKFPTAIEVTIAALKTVKDTFREFFNFVKLLDDLFMKTLGGNFEPLKKMANVLFSTPTQYAGPASASLDAMKRAQGSFTETSKQYAPSISVNAPITVTVPPGTDPKDVGSHVQAGIKDAMDKAFKHANRNFEMAVE